MSDLCELSLAELSEQIHAEAVTPLEATEACLRRIEAQNGELNAFLTVTGESAREEAVRLGEELQAGKWRGPLHGVPLALKDLYLTKGVRTTAGSAILGEWVPDHDATVVRRLRQAGAVLLGNGGRPLPGASQGVRLRLKWVHQRSFSGDYPVCMQLGLSADRARGHLDYPSWNEAEADGALSLRQDIRLLPHLFDIGIHEYAKLVRDGWVDPDQVDHFLCHYSSEKFIPVVEDLMEKAGLTMPDAPTWDFIADAARKMTDRNAGINGICLRGKAGLASCGEVGERFHGRPPQNRSQNSHAMSRTARTWSARLRAWVTGKRRRSRIRGLPVHRGPR